MISKYKVILHSQNGAVPYNIGYQLYGSLMERFPSSVCEWLHTNEMAPLTQYFAYNSRRNEYSWNICAFNDDLAEVVLQALSRDKTICVDKANHRFLIDEIVKESIPSAKELMSQSQKVFENTSQIEVRFVTPTTFKQDGKYVLFPTVPMMIGNLVHKWNCYNSTMVIDDEYAVNQMMEGLSINRYKLQSTNYYLKGVKITGFVGTVTLQSRLPEPLLEVVKLLFYFANYSGIGIKATLGMGGAVTAPVRRRCEPEVNM